MEQLQSMDVLQRLSVSSGQLTKSQKAVADYYSEHMMEAAFSTIDKIAHATNVSTTTVVRLALALGYSGYAEFQSALKKYLTTMTAPIHMFSTTSQAEDIQSGEDSFTYMMELEFKNLRETCAALSAVKMEKTTDALCRARRIYVIGARSCEGAARFLAYNLDRMFLNTRFMESNINQAPEFINSMTGEDVLIYIGFSRYVKTIGEVTRLAKAHDVTVIGITDTESSPWRAFADYVFLCANESSSFFHSPVSIFYVANILLKECAQKNSERVKENLHKLETTSQALRIFERK